MNRGSAIKWAEALGKTDWHMDSSQLRFEAGEKTFACPIGVLANFLDPDAWNLAWDGVSYTWRGEQFTIPKDSAKKCKMRCDPVAVSDYIAKHCATQKEAAAFVMENYETM